MININGYYNSDNNEMLSQFKDRILSDNIEDISINNNEILVRMSDGIVGVFNIDNVNNSYIDFSEYMHSDIRFNDQGDISKTLSLVNGLNNTVTEISEMLSEFEDIISDIEYYNKDNIEDIEDNKESNEI